ncbi:ClpX C4-type zinc finger protein [Pseudomonas sp.]|uniref:ClpX C4-type zinc finger protein n=1 Tax=Pseudomonas sp. TaxID=306 RepID=UPI002EDAEBFC
MSKTTILSCDFCGRAETDCGLMISNKENGAAICEHCIRESANYLMGTYIERDAQGRQMMRNAQAAAAANGVELPATAAEALQHQPAIPAPVAVPEPLPV